MNNFSERLAKLIKDREISQSSLEAAGLDQSSVSRWASGTSPEAFGKLAGLCKFLGVKADWLLGLEEEGAVAELRESAMAQGEAERRRAELAEKRLEVLLKGLRGLLDKVERMEQFPKATLSKRASSSVPGDVIAAGERVGEIAIPKKS